MTASKHGFIVSLLILIGFAGFYGCGGSNSSVQSNAGDAAALSQTSSHGKAPDVMLENAEPPMLVIDNPPVSETGRSAFTPWVGPQGSDGYSLDTAGNSDIEYAFDGDYTTNWVGTNGLSEWDIYYTFENDRSIDRVSVNFYNSSYLPATRTQLCISHDGISWATYDMATSTYWYVNKEFGINATSAKYIWIHMEGKPAALYPVLREIDWEPVAENDTAYASPGYNHSIYYPSQLFDDNESTVWTGEIGGQEWNVYYKFDDTTDVRMVTARMLNNDNHPADMTLSTSNDGFSWTEIGDMEYASYTMQYVGDSTKYIKINMQDSGGAYFPYIKEITWESVPVGGSSGDSINQTYIGPNAFDDNHSTWWAGNTSQSQWDVFYNFSTSTWVDSIMPYFYSASYVPDQTNVYCSDDAMTWNQVASSTSGVCPVLSVNDYCTYLRFTFDGAPTIGYPIIHDIDWGEWIPLGAGAGTGNGISDSYYGWNPAIGIDSSNVAYVAYYAHDGVPNSYLYVKKFGCPSWSVVGGTYLATNVSNNSKTDISIDSSNRPFVVWPTLQNTDIYGKIWTGSQWNEVAYSASSGGISGSNGYGNFSPVVAHDSNDTIFVAWEVEDRGGYGENVFLKYSTGTAWAELGNSATGYGITDGSAGSPDLAIYEDATGTHPVVVWDAGTKIYLKMWSGSDWEEIDGSASGSGISQTSSYIGYPKVGIDSSNKIYVAYVSGTEYDMDVYVSTYDGSSWATATLVANTTNKAISPSLFIENDVVYIAWQDNDGTDDEIYLKKLNGSTWEEVGTQTASATDGGVTDDSNTSMSPSVVVTTAGKILLAYRNHYISGGSGYSNIYVKQFIE